MKVHFCIIFFTVKVTEKSGSDFRKRKNNGKRQRMHLLYQGMMTTWIKRKRL